MKKFLLTAVALGAVVGLAVSASAVELKVKGNYDVEGYYINNGNGAAGGGGVSPWSNSNSDTWYWHVFRLQPDLIINDKVMMKGDIRLVDDNSVWGGQQGGDLDRFNGHGLRIDKVWLVYDSPIGKWEVGRRPAGAWMFDFVNTSTAADRIMWWAPTPENFKAYAFLQKSVEQDGYSAAQDDNDNDYYEVAGGYTTKPLNLWLGLGMKKDKTNDHSPVVFIDDTGAVVGYDPGSEQTMYRVKGYGDTSFANFTVLGEFDYKWGQNEYNDGSPDRDIKALAYIVAGVGSFGDTTVTAGFAHIDGQEGGTNPDITAYDPNMGTGKDFAPLYILTGEACNILNGNLGANPVGTAVRTSGANAALALVDFKATEDLTLHGGIGWGQADDTDWLGIPGVDDAYGWEFDVGLAYKLYDNLTYEVHLGYWAVGDFAKLGALNLDTDDVYLVSHHLSMSF